METLTVKKAVTKKPRVKKLPVAVEAVEVVPQLAIIDKQNRRILSEGRSYQMGFAFLQKKSENVFETVQPISPCKDYLNDVVYSEQTGKACRAYGLSYNKIGIFEEDKAYLCFKICNNFGGSTYNGQEADEKNLVSNYKNIEKFINFFETQLGTKIVSKIEKIEDNLYHITLPIFWCKYSYLISLYSLLVRCGQYYTGGDELKYFKNFGKFGEAYNILNVTPKLQMILEGALPVQDFSTYGGGTDVHNTGIVNFKF